MCKNTQALDISAQAGISTENLFLFRWRASTGSNRKITSAAN
jgi:hypothetical protein